MKVLLCLIVFICFANATSKNSEALDVINSQDSFRQLISSDESTTNLRGSEDLIKIEPNEPAHGDSATVPILIMKDGTEVEEFDNFARTATGGIVNTIMVALTVFAFLGNGAFMVYVFWLSK